MNVVSLHSSYSMSFHEYIFVVSKTKFRAIFVILAIAHVYKLIFISRRLNLLGHVFFKRSDIIALQGERGK